MVDSPCVNVCAVADGMCVSCGRTLNEIASWQSMSEADRAAVVDEIQHGTREYPKSE